MAGGAREGAGRPAIPQKEKKRAYATKLRPDQIKWIQSQKRGWAAKFFEQVIDEAMEAKK
jgi:hypothetical protein